MLFMELSELLPISPFPQGFMPVVNSKETKKTQSVISLLHLSLLLHFPVGCYLLTLAKLICQETKHCNATQ